MTGVDYTSSLFYSAKSVARVQKYQRKKLMSMRCWNCIHWFSFWTPATDFTQNERTARSLCMIGALSRRISIAACCCTALLMFCFSIVSIHACRNFYPTVLVGVVDKAFRRSPILPLECNCGDHEQNFASSHNRRPVSVDVIVFWKSRQRSMS